MSTIASPRPSIALSSRRNSASTDITVTTTATRQTTTAAERAALRRNRAALRDYYNLKDAAPADGSETPVTPVIETDRESELDKPGFEPEAYVERLLGNEGLEGVLRIEAGLISDIRSLDGEKKALVYDNYSKLIAATDTIRSMREKMDPLTPTTITLTPAIGHIAETAARLSADLKESHAQQKPAGTSVDDTRRRQQETVKWVLDTPARLNEKVENGRRDAAKEDWEEVSSILSRWQSVKGVGELRQACLKALKEDTDD